MEVIELKVIGMHCGACVRRVMTTLMAVPGVSHVDVDLARGRARVEGALSAGVEPLIAALALHDYAAILAVGHDAAASPAARKPEPGAGTPIGSCCP